MTDHDVHVVVEPPSPDVVVFVEDLSQEVAISVEPPLPEVAVDVTATDAVNVVVEPELPAVEVVVSDVALPGRDGIDGAPGRDGIDGKDATDVGGAIHDHIYSQNPHPAYDDGPSFVLLYQNKKV